MVCEDNPLEILPPAVGYSQEYGIVPVFKQIPRLVGQLKSGLRVSASFKKNHRLVGRLGPGPRRVGRLVSGAWVSTSFQIVPYG